MAWDYPDKLKEIARNPQYVDEKIGLVKLIEQDEKLIDALAKGSLVCAKRDIGEDTLYIGCYGSPACGDYMSLFILVNNGSNTIEKVSYNNFGCTSSIGASEMGAIMINEASRFKGGVFDEKTLEPLVTNKEIIRKLSDIDENGRIVKSVPRQKYHCSVMFEQALRNLIKAYTHSDIYSSLSDNQSLVIELEEGPLVCHCFDVHEKMITRILPDIDKEVKELLTSGRIEPGDKEEIVRYFHERIRESTKAGEACGKCHYDRSPSIESIILREYPQYNPNIDDVIGVQQKVQQHEEKKEKPYFALSFLERVTRIQEVIENYIKPTLERDGGGIELVGLEGDIVRVALSGACAHCAISALTLNYGVERVLKETVYDKLKVENISEMQTGPAELLQL